MGKDGLRKVVALTGGQIWGGWGRGWKVGEFELRRDSMEKCYVRGSRAVA